MYPRTYYMLGMILIIDDLAKNKKKSLSQVLFQQSYFTHCLFEKQSQISAKFLFAGRFSSKSDVVLKNLISSPTSSPHKTISFLPPTAFYLERALYSPQDLYMLFSLLAFLVYTRLGFKLQHEGYSPTLCAPWFHGQHNISASEFS